MEQIQRISNELCVAIIALNAKINTCNKTSNFIGADGYLDCDMFTKHGKAFNEIIPIVSLVVDKFQELEVATGKYSSEVERLIGGYNDAT